MTIPFGKLSRTKSSRNYALKHHEELVSVRNRYKGIVVHDHFFEGTRMPRALGIRVHRADHHWWKTLGIRVHRADHHWWKKETLDLLSENEEPIGMGIIYPRYCDYSRRDGFKPVCRRDLRWRLRQLVSSGELESYSSGRWKKYGKVKN